MTDDDFEVVRRAWAAASRADEDGTVQEFHPEIAAVPFGAAMEAMSYLGPEEVLGWWREEILTNWETFQVIPEKFQRAGDKLLVTGRWVGVLSMPLPGCCLSAVSSSAALTNGVLAHSAFSSVRETTIFGMLFILAATLGSSSAILISSSL